MEVYYKIFNKIFSFDDKINNIYGVPTVLDVYTGVTTTPKGYIKVKLTQNLINEARSRFQAVQESVMGGNFTNKFVTENRWIEHVGQISVERWLLTLGVDFKVDYALGRADDFDIKIDNIKIDVKTSTFDHRKGIQPYVFVNADQIENKTFDVYIFVKYSEAEMCCYIVGWAFGCKVVGHKTVTSIVNTKLAAPCKALLISGLKPMGVLLNEVYNN